MAQAANQQAGSAEPRTARSMLVFVVALLVVLRLGGCVRDGGPHPEPPAPIDDAGRENPDDLGSSGQGGGSGVAGGAGLGGGTGGAGGGGFGTGGAGDSEHPPTCEGPKDAGVDAEIEDEDAGPLR